jgi:hypothetical protein
MLPQIGRITTYSWPSGSGDTGSAGVPGSGHIGREPVTQGQEILLTLAAWGPFCPWTISNST